MFIDNPGNQKPAIMQELAEEESKQKDAAHEQRRYETARDAMCALIKVPANKNCDVEMIAMIAVECADQLLKRLKR